MLTIRCNHVRLAKKLQHQQQHRTLMKGRHIAMIANTSTTTNHCTIPRQKIATILTPCTKYKKTSTQNVAPQCRHKHTHTHTHTHAKPQKNDGWLRHMHSATLDGLKTINNDNLFTPTQWGRKSQNATTKVPPHTHTHTHTHTHARAKTHHETNRQNRQNP